jgi:hypothetical protein
MMTNKKEYNKRHGFKPDEPHSKKEISQISSIPKDVLDEVYDRGIGAYKTAPQSVRMKGTYKKGVKAPMSKKLPKEQWAMSRVYSMVNKLEGPRKLNHDKDLVKKIPKYRNRDISKL